jgi:chemotaxis protein CheZ
MAKTKTQQLDELVTNLNTKRKDAVTFADVLALAEVTAQSLQLFFDTMDTAVYREMREIAGYIERMKSEIGALQADDIKQSHIPAAGQELSAIVKATERATVSIMECAEALMEADASDPAAYKALVDEKMILIFEACSFQDITGQRIAKVIETLQQIETRVSRFATAVGVVSDHAFADEQERIRAERRERLLLHGPQVEGAGINQAEVDALISGRAS